MELQTKQQIALSLSSTGLHPVHHTAAITSAGFESLAVAPDGVAVASLCPSLFAGAAPAAFGPTPACLGTNSAAPVLKRILRLA
jgi:hypothetical protein